MSRSHRNVDVSQCDHCDYTVDGWYPRAWDWSMELPRDEDVEVLVEWRGKLLKVYPEHEYEYKGKRYFTKYQHPKHVGRYLRVAEMGAAGQLCEQSGTHPHELDPPHLSDGGVMELVLTQYDPPRPVYDNQCARCADTNYGPGSMLFFGPRKKWDPRFRWIRKPST